MRTTLANAVSPRTAAGPVDTRAPRAEDASSPARTPSGWTDRAGRLVLGLDGGLLAVVGLTQAIFDLLGGFVGRGPLGAHVLRAPLMIGLFEAHGLATIAGIALFRARRRPRPLEAHLAAAAVHALLGGANLLWWSSFAALEMVPAGLAATIAHGLFLVANLVCAARIVPDVVTGPGASFRWAALATLVSGMWLHGTRLAVGHEAFVATVFTPNVDTLLAIPMTYAGISGLMLWRRAEHANLLEKLAHGFVLAYFTISIPLHARSIIARDMGHFAAFPDWYSAPILALMVALVIVILRLRFRPATSASSPAAQAA